MNDYNSKEYKRSRGAYMTQCTVEYFVSLLVADAFLAKLLSSLGISDALTGIISSFITLAFVIQLASIFLVRAKVSTKRLVITFDTLSIFFFMLLYLVPFLPVGQGGKTVLVILSVLFAYVGKYLILSLCFKWGNSYVEPTKRASFSATKEMISLFTGMGFTAIIGYIIDKFESLGNLNGGFLFIAISIFILNISNFICLFLIRKEDATEHAGDSQPLRVVLANTLGNKDFRNIIILSVLWDVARYFTTGFLGIFKTKDLVMSVFLVQLVNILSNFARMLVSKPFGRYSDKHSYAKGFELGLTLSAVAFFINMFTTRSTWFLIIIFTLLNSCSAAGTNANSFNIAYSYVDSRYITQAMAVKNSIGGLFGFGASLLGGKILAAVQANGNQVLGIPLYGQQILSGISCLILVVAIIFIRKVIAKQKVMVQ